MKNISIESLIKKLKESGPITILSTDIDPRFDEAQKILETKVPNLKFQHPNDLVNDKIREELLDLYINLRSGKNLLKN